ncbi:MAG: hydrogenase iron-sulfur subunit [Lentimicrobiaceae bacterium]|nr:hydrogenase iron-sulfur subunit [Lentimicrobiaceae bacterium]
MNNTLGIYICTGCGIYDSVNAEALLEHISSAFPAATCRLHPSLCSDNGIHQIQEDIRSCPLEKVVIGACTPRIHSERFTFDQHLLVERVNLREQVAWCQPGGTDNTAMLAEDMLKMGIARILNIKTPVPWIPEKVHDRILVVGGGITGITAALEGAGAGYPIVLVEKEPAPGGWMNHLYKQLPFNEPFQSPIPPVIQEKIDALAAESRITVLTSSFIERVEGHPGDFEVTIRQNGSVSTIRAGAIILATGWKPYDPGNLKHLGYGRFKGVITQLDLEKCAGQDQWDQLLPKRPENGVLFIQCAGSRDPGHLPYCSSYCCATTLKQTTYLREKYPDLPVYVIYKDLRTPGHLEQFYQYVQHDDLLFLTKGEVTGITEKDGLITVKAENTLFEEIITMDVDLVVLATGMVPSDSTELNLTYRQGKGLPELKYGFPDSHFICFPYETRRTGIYAAGACRAPMDSASCMEDAAGAMLKAIQCIGATRRGEAVHPRSGDCTFPELYMPRCTDCKRCTEECPFGAYDETTKGTPLPHPTRCRRCGICLGACPERIINFSDLSIESVSAMIKSVHIPDEFEEKPRILAFVCENDAYPAFDRTGQKRLHYDPSLRIIPVRCIGSVNKIWITDALSAGFDGIMLLGCKSGENYQCHFIQGSELTQKRTENFQEALRTMMLEPERIRMEFIEITDYEKIPALIREYMKILERIGPNPFKGI